MKLLTRQHRSILLARVAALVLAGVCLVQLHLLQQRRWADVQLTDAEAEAGGSACCERPQARHQVAAVQGLVAQPTAAALVAAATAGVQGGTWLQIGANTMDAALNGNDPVIALLDGIPSWTKLFVEPIPPLFQRLERSVRRWPNSTAINLAVNPDPGVAEATSQMWCLKESFDTQRLGADLPPWLDQICSFDRNHITKHLHLVKPNVTTTVAPVTVTAVSLAELVRRHHLADHLDVLLIDTEGFDFHVVRQIPLAGVRPRLVFWEHSHLSPEQRQSSCGRTATQCGS